MENGGLVILHQGFGPARCHGFLVSNERNNLLIGVSPPGSRRLWDDINPETPGAPSNNPARVTADFLNAPRHAVRVLTSRVLNGYLVRWSRD